MANFFAGGSSIWIYGGIFNGVNNTSGGNIIIINRTTANEIPPENAAPPDTDGCYSDSEGVGQCLPLPVVINPVILLCRSSK